MALGKVFQMSGLYKGPQRQAEPAGGHRRALNVWQDRTGKWRPKGEQTPWATPVGPFADTTILRTGFLRRFKGGVFGCFLGNYDFTANPYNAIYSSNFFKFWDKDGNDITPKYNEAGSLGPDTGDWTFGRNSYPNTVIGNKLFFKAGFLPLQKFDGVQVLRAGLPLPYISCAQYAVTGIVRYVRAIQVRIGFDGTLVSSGYVQFPVNANTVVIETRPSAITSEIVGKPSVSPTFRDSFRRTASYLDDVASMRIDPASPWSSGAGTMTVTAAWHNLQIGDWVMFQDGTTIGTGILDTGYHLLAMKVTNVVGNVITFNSAGKGYRKTTQTWAETTMSTSMAPFNPASQAFAGTSTYLLVYSSTTENGTYLLNATQPLVAVDGEAAVSANAPFTSFLSTPQTFGFVTTQITRDLQGWYDIGTVKLPFPKDYTDDGSPGILGLTKYQGQLLSYDKKAIYFSDTTAGGSDEMTSGFANFVPLGTEYGDIVCVEGCEDFIFISRERKNYVLVGDISTGNFTISECDSETSGAFSSTSAIAAKGGIFYITRQGIFYVSSSGLIVEVTQGINRLFGSSREFTADPDNISFQPYLMTDATPSMSGWDGNIVKIKYDPDRNLIAFLYGKKKELGAADLEDRYAVLAMNLKTGAFYEWKTNQVSSLDVLVTDIEFFESYDAVTGKFKGSLIQGGTTLTREDNTAAKVSDMYLISSWLVGGEPSLEKQAQQIKFYGQMTSCRIFHQENWEPFTSIANIVAPRTNVIWPTSGNQNTNPFEHKQRLNTSSCQAISIGFEPLDLNFSLEGYELEWDVRQGDMKK